MKGIVVMKGEILCEELYSLFSFSFSIIRLTLSIFLPFQFLWFLTRSINSSFYDLAIAFRLNALFKISTTSGQSFFLGFSIKNVYHNNQYF